MEIKVGDYINGEKILKINKDPFVRDQINILVDKYEIDAFGDRSQKVYRIKKED